MDFSLSASKDSLKLAPRWLVCCSQVKSSTFYLIYLFFFTVNGNWEPLMKASVRCGFGVVVHPEGVVVSVHYVPCLEKKVLYKWLPLYENVFFFPSFFKNM